MPLSEVGLALGRWRAGLAWRAIGIPLALVVGKFGSGNPELRFVHTLNTSVQPEITGFVPYALSQFLYYRAWEVLSRGVLLFGLMDLVSTCPGA